jgi:metal-dependent amidase/aminoacylase/carboxypeptidase family protein
MTPDTVTDACPPSMSSEDFARMPALVPGNFVFVGNGATATLHIPAPPRTGARLRDRRARGRA